MQQTLVEYLINAAWQVPLVVAGALIVTHIGGLSPRARNLVWLAFLVMAVASPALPVDLLSATHAAPTPTPAAMATAAEVASYAAAPTPFMPVSDRQSPWRLLRIGLDWRSASLIKFAFGAAAGGLGAAGRSGARRPAAGAGLR